MMMMSRGIMTTIERDILYNEQLDNPHLPWIDSLHIFFLPDFLSCP